MGIIQAVLQQKGMDETGQLTAIKDHIDFKMNISEMLRELETHFNLGAGISSWRSGGGNGVDVIVIDMCGGWSCTYWSDSGGMDHAIFDSVIWPKFSEYLTREREKDSNPR